ncbi:MAG: hypothetical protein K940chlam9_01738 [Chlamydiae bacterium]|nr:hypothetical protein [Chlamydiota bacterium]
MGTWAFNRFGLHPCDTELIETCTERVKNHLFLMIAGRLEFFALLIAFVPAFWKTTY